MSNRKRGSGGFSLVEVTVALAVAAISLLAVFGLLPIGAQTNRAAIGQTTAAAILSSVLVDMRSTPVANSTTAAFGITFGTSTTLYFDGAGQYAPAINADSRYRLTVSFPSSPTGAFAPTFVYLKVTWPAQANIDSASGSAEAFAAFDRH
jgi:uncharacterized protein (TIGR02598 family)